LIIRFAALYQLLLAVAFLKKYATEKYFLSIVFALPEVSIIEPTQPVWLDVSEYSIYMLLT